MENIYPISFLRCKSPDANSYSLLIMKLEKSLPDGSISPARHFIITLAVFFEIRFDGFDNDLDTSISITISLKFVSTVLSRNKSSSFLSSCNYTEY